jgi:hypothetical protein
MESIPRGNTHIVALFRSDFLTQSYDPWLVMQYAYKAKLVSVLLLCNYWLEFNETIWEPSISSGDAHIVALFRSDIITQSYGRWLVMQYAYRAIIVSALLHCVYCLEFNATFLESSISGGDAHIVGFLLSNLSSQSYSPWLVMHYAYRAKIVSALLLWNYWLVFNETLWKPLILRGDGHTVALFLSDTLIQSYGPW